MLGTLSAIIVAVILYFSLAAKEVIENALTLTLIVLGLTSLFTLIRYIILGFACSPLQKTEQNLTPRILETYKNDRVLRGASVLNCLFVFYSLFFALDLLLTHYIPPIYLTLLWVVLFGLSVDAMHHSYNRILDLLNPFHIVDHFSQFAQVCIRQTKEVELCDWIDAISETTVKAISRNSASLSLHASDKLLSITKTYLEVAKGITYHAEEDSVKFGGADHVSYMLFYLFQRLEMIFDKALNAGLEPLCSKVVTTLGKIGVYCAKYDITVVDYPIHYIGKLTRRAQRGGMQEVGNRATLTLLEVSKLLIKEVDLQYVEIKGIFLAILNTMHEIANNTFRNDKGISIQILTQPFYDIKTLFQEGNVSNHQDTGSIIQNIDLILGQFATLETVMSTMPPIPEIVKEREESEKAQAPKPEE